MIRRLVLALALIFAAAPAFAFDPAEALKDPVLETRARSIGEGLRCVVCQNQSIEESNADLARAMRVLVRERLAAGDSDSEVIGALEARYGDFIRLMPPLKATTALLWAAPALLLVGGLVAWRRAFRARAEAAGGAPLPPEEAAAQPGTTTLAIGAAIAVVASVAVYALLGHPGVADQPIRPRLAERLGVSEAAIDDMQRMAGEIETRLETHPDDARAWLMLGRADRYLGRHAEAAAALRRAIALGEAEAGVYADLGESLAIRDRRVGPEAEEAFARALAIAPDEPRAIFFLGVARAEAGDLAAAAKIWRSGAAMQPADSPWRRRLTLQADRAEAARKP